MVIIEDGRNSKEGGMTWAEIEGMHRVTFGFPEQLDNPVTPKPLALEIVYLANSAGRTSRLQRASSFER